MHKATLNRAVKRAQTTLPTSPRKCQKVVQKLAVKFSPESFLPPFKRKERAHVNVDVLTDVLNFYERDDISTQAAGKKEFVIRENGEKTKVQKRYLNMTISEAYSQFKQDFPDGKIGKSSLLI